jgi:hypothetical protein
MSGEAVNVTMLAVLALVMGLLAVSVAEERDQCLQERDGLIEAPKAK